MNIKGFIVGAAISLVAAYLWPLILPPPIDWIWGTVVAFALTIIGLNFPTHRDTRR